MLSRITVSAPGKVIISGEHAVVHGYPAIVAATDLLAKVTIEKSKGKPTVYPESAEGIVLRCLKECENSLGTKFKNLNIRLESDIPVGCGMGSSAAISVGMAASLTAYIEGKSDLKKVNEIAYETEKFYHGNPSGVDTIISTYGGFLWYRKESEKFKTFSKIKIVKKLPELFFLNTGMPKETTKETVAHVSELLKKHPQKTQRIFNEIEAVTRSLLQILLAEKNYDLVDLFKTNERFLEKLEVVSESTKDLIRKIEKTGGAAKMSGGGGIKGASGIILVYHPDTGKIEQLMSKMKIKLNKVKLGAKGVRIEKN